MRRQCVDEIVVLDDRHLSHVLNSFMNYYHEVRKHFSLNKDPPVARSVRRVGDIVCHSVVGELNHRRPSISEIEAAIGHSRADLARRFLLEVASLDGLLPKNHKRGVPEVVAAFVMAFYAGLPLGAIPFSKVFKWGRDASDKNLEITDGQSPV